MTDKRRPLWLIATTLLLAPATLEAKDWLQWGGPNGDFTVEAKGLVERWPEDGPKTLWKRPLGAGYSSILYMEGRLFTMYRDGDQEVVVSLDARTGATQWERRYETDLWPDMTDAFGLGPNATPLIAGRRLVSTGIDGQLHGLDVDSGEVLWKHDLPAKYGRRKRIEEYGYSASPLPYQDKVITLVGGDDHAVIAFDPEDGAVAWKSEPGGVSYAAPTLTTLGGLDQFIYFEPEGVVALDPSTGRTLWKSPMEFRNGNHLTPIVRCDERHIWVGSQFPTGGGRLLEVTRKGQEWTADRVWFETYLRASHWTSIRIGDYIYGSIGGNNVSVFAAFDWRTGKFAWRKRGFHKAQMLYAEDKVLFLDEAGQLVLARVSPEKLDVLDTAQVTGSVSWSLPTLAGTRLYLRDQENVLALDLSVGGAEAAVKREERSLIEQAAIHGKFGELIRRVEHAEDKSALIDEFFSKQESFPIVEDDSLVHFVFRGEVPDVVVAGNFLEAGQFEPLYHVPETDLFFRSYQLAPAAHFEYRFGVFDDSMTDSLNPRTLTGSGDLPSVFATRGWSEPSHLGEPAGTRGQLETFAWNSTVLGNEREISVYLPVGYETGEGRYPLVMVNYGNQALDQGKWANSLDNLIGKSVAPLIAAFVPRVSFGDYGPRVAQFAEAIARELVPELENRYRVLPGAENRAMTGIASGGFATAFLALQRPAVLGKAAVQSFYFREEAKAELVSLIEQAKQPKAAFYVEWSLNDFKSPSGMDSEAHSRQLAELLRDKGHGVVAHEVSDGAGWGNWRARNDRILETFFPLKE